MRAPPNRAPQEPFGHARVPRRHAWAYPARVREDLHPDVAGHLPGAPQHFLEPAPRVEVSRSNVSLVDREHAIGALNDQVARLRRPRFRGDGAGTRLLLQRTAWGPLALDRIGIRMDVAVDVAPIPDVMITTITAGHVGVSGPDGAIVQAAGESRLLAPQAQPRYEIHGHDSFLLQIPYEELVATASEITGDPDHRLRFLSAAPISAAMNQSWTGVVGLVRAELDSAGPVSPMRLATLMRVVSAGALAAFPNTTMTTTCDLTDGWVGPTVLARAIDFIEAHAHEPIRMREVASAAGVGTRQLRRAFRRHLDTTPSDYLLVVRLNRAHDRLVAYDEPIAQLATEAGFASAAGFAREYQRIFGRSPVAARAPRR